MTVRVADAKKLNEIIVKDIHGNVQEVIIPADLQVGFSGNPSSLILLGGLRVATKTVDFRNLTNSSYYVQEEDFLINVYSPSSSASVFLPDNPQIGQSYAIHDKSGLATTLPISVFSSKNGTLVDSSSSLAITTNFGSLFLAWEGSEWINLLTSSGVEPTVSSSIAASLDGLRWELPRVGNLQAAGLSAPCDNGTGVRTLMGGDEDTLYNVTLRFRGEVEPAPYVSGTVISTNIYHGGTYDPSGITLSTVRNTYVLQIGDPSDYWFLNRYSGTEGTNTTFAIDITMTIQIRGQSSVSLIAKERPAIGNGSGGVCAESANSTNVTVPGVDPYPTAYDGQFIQMNVLNVTVA